VLDIRRAVGHAHGVGDKSMKTYMLMLLVSTILGFAYWAKSNEAPAVKRA
jgi:hypothetical protein